MGLLRLKTVVQPEIVDTRKGEAERTTVHIPAPGMPD
jgi:hypothetical protein